MGFREKVFFIREIFKYKLDDVSEKRRRFFIYIIQKSQKKQLI